MEYIQNCLRKDITKMNSEKKVIFILGGSELQVPAIKKAKECGMYVFVLDYNPEAVGRRYADTFLEISTIDIDAVYTAAIRYSPDYIITSTSDMPVRTVAWVNEKLGKRSGISYANSLCVTDKALMRQRMERKLVPIPAYYVVHSFSEFMHYIPKMENKFIIKPADNAASRGVCLVEKKNVNEYIRIYEYSKKYARNGVVLLEEYMEGAEVSVEIYVVEGKPHVIAITDKYITKIPFFVELGHTEPSQLSADVQNEVKKIAYEAVKAVEIKNGPAHVEIKITSNGVKLVEIAARLGGDFITSRLVPLSTGVDMVGATFDNLQGKRVDLKSNIHQGAAIRFLTGNDGIICKIEGIQEARKMKGIQEVVLYKREGDRVTIPHNSGDRLGHIIGIGKNALEAEKNVERALDTIHIYYADL